MPKLLKKKQIFVLMLIAVFVLSLASFAAAQPTDIKGHWAEQQMSNWFSKGLAKGYADGTFKPDNTITRAEFAAMVNRAFNFTATGTVSFPDVGANKWYAKDVSIASAAGYISGYGDGTFGPDKKITRQEAAVMIARILKLDTSDISQANIFSDADKIQEWGKGAISAIYKAKIMQGYQDKSFRPGNPITRAESVVTIDRSMGYAPEEDVEEDADDATSAIEGQVTLDGKGVKAEVLIFANGKYEVLKKINTNKDGAFKVELAAGTYDITASTDKEVGYASGVKVAADKVSKLDIELEEAAIVKGELLDKNGKAVKNVDIVFTTNPTFVGQTNSKGEFSVPVLPDRSYEVRANKSDKDDDLVVVAKSLKVGKAGTFKLDDPVKASFAVSSGGGGGGGGGSSSIAVSDISVEGVPVVGATLKAVDLKPTNANVEYQWLIADEADGEFKPIDGATDSTYTPVKNDEGKYIKVKITGKGNYRGTVISEVAVGPVVVAEAGELVAATGYSSYNNWKDAINNESGSIDFGYINKSDAIKMGIADPDYYGVAMNLKVGEDIILLNSPEVTKAIRVTPSGDVIEALVTEGGQGVQFVHTGWGEVGEYTMYYYMADKVIEAKITVNSLVFWDEILQGYAVKVGVETLSDIDVMAFLEAVAEWESADETDGKLGYKNGKIIFENTKTSDEYGRTSGLSLTTTPPTKERTAESYVSITKDETTYYVVFDATPKAGADGRTSKYLCAIAAPATGYDEAKPLADIEGYVFDFFFGQDPSGDV